MTFGADGDFSAIRTSMQKTPRFNYSQQYLEYGYKELSIPPGPQGAHLIEKNALHIWPRGHFMLIALPNFDGSFTCTLFLPYEGDEGFDQLNREDQIKAFFEKHFPDTIPLMPELVSDFQQNPTGSLVTVRCNPWQYDHKFLLIGDASHAIVPFYGQGMNSGFEDCTILDELLDEYEEDWATVIKMFSETRPKDTNAIADLALRNFIEMRDLVADPQFLLRKEMEAYFNKQYVGRFNPLYSLVTFSHVPYSQALKEGHDQDRLFGEILALPGVEDNWQDNAEVHQIFQHWIEHK